MNKIGRTIVYNTDDVLNDINMNHSAGKNGYSFLIRIKNENLNKL